MNDLPKKKKSIEQILIDTNTDDRTIAEFLDEEQKIQTSNVSIYLAHLKKQLLQDGNWQNISLTRQWPMDITNKAGVYVFKSDQGIVYVGETGNIRKRMTDLLDSRNHTVRRSLGTKLFSDHPEYEKATSSKTFSPAIEFLLNEHITNNLMVAYLEVPLGRKELEELIVQQIPEDIRLNIRVKRK